MTLSVCSPLTLASLLPREERLWLSAVKVLRFMFTLSMQCHCVLYVQFVRTLPLSHPLSLFFCLSVAPSVSGDSGSLLMSEIVDIPDDSSPSEDSCVLEVAFAVRSRARGVSEGGEGFDYNVPQPPAARCFFRGERSNSCSSPSTYNTSSFR